MVEQRQAFGIGNDQKLLAGNDPITGRRWNIDRPGYNVVIVKMLASGGTLGGGIVLAGLTYQVCERCGVKCG